MRRSWRCSFWDISVGRWRPRGSASPNRRGVDAAAKLIDFRLLVIGSILPDIVDKSLWLLFFPEDLNATRLIAHTLWFPILLLLGWWFGSRRGLNFLLPLGIGSALHLVFDGMFAMPATLLWPFMGWGFFVVAQSPFHVPLATGFAVIEMGQRRRG